MKSLPRNPSALALFLLAALALVAAGGNPAPTSTAPAPTAKPPDASTPGKYDDLALRLLKEAAAHLVLRKTTLKETVPEYWVEPAGEQLTWAEAVAYADEHFKDDGDKRALFLWHYLYSGAPTARLNDLKLHDTGMSMESGSGRSQAYYLGATVEKAPPPVTDTTGEHAFLLAFDRVSGKATLGFFVGYGFDDPITQSLVRSGPPFVMPDEPSILLSEGGLQINRATIGGVDYDNLSFDPDGRLTGFSRRWTSDDGAAEIEVSGNTSGEDGRNFFYATITVPGGGYQEQLQFTPDLVLAKREIQDAATRDTLSWWRPKSLPPAAWPKDAPVEPAFFAYFPETDSGPDAARASAAYWLPSGDVMPAGWRRTPITDSPLPEFKPEVHQQVVQVWLRHRPGPACVVAWSTIEVPRDGGWGDLYMWRKMQDFPDPGKPGTGYTCETLSIHAERHAPTQGNLKVQYTLPAEARTGLVRPGAALPAELPAAAVVSKIAEQAGGGTVLELSLLHYGHAALNGRFFVWAIMQDGREVPMDVGERKDGPHHTQTAPCTAAIRLADVREFKVSYCRYHTAVFENISLAPLP